jgi:hypothetical protein
MTFPEHLSINCRQSIIFRTTLHTVYKVDATFNLPVVQRHSFTTIRPTMLPSTHKLDNTPEKMSKHIGKLKAQAA